MFEIRRAAERGHANHGWLDSWHSFSFADYQDSRHMGFGPLRVINEDRVAPSTGFGIHGHRDMEIVSYVLAGTLAHRDSMGNGGTLLPGHVQRMSAGTGVRHSEFNERTDGVTHFLQIWIEPKQRGIVPSYEEKYFSEASKRGRLCLVASPDGRYGSVTLHQDAQLYAALLDGVERTALDLMPSRRAYVHVARGTAHVNGHTLQAGDALKLTGESALELDRGRNAEVLVFDLP